MTDDDVNLIVRDFWTRRFIPTHHYSSLCGRIRSNEVGGIDCI